MLRILRPRRLVSVWTPSRPRVLRHSLGALVVLALLSGYAFFLWTLPPSQISVVLSGHAEYARYRVINPEFATIRIAGMRAEGGGSLHGRCVDAVVTPARGASVEYRRGDDKYYRIGIRPATGSQTAFSLRESGAERREVRDGVVFRVVADDDQCSSDDAPSRLPIWGPAQFGDVQRTPGDDGRIAPGALIDGTLSVFGRAHDRLLGLRFPSSIYLVNSFDLPPWSVLSARGDEGGRDPGPNSGDAQAASTRGRPGAAETAAWTGSVGVEEDTLGFAVHASSQARQIMLHAAGLNASQAGGNQAIDLGNYAQFLNDPNIIQIQFLGGAFLFLFQSLSWIMSFVDAYLFKEKDEIEPS